MNGHPTREEDFDLYALGALEGGEKLAIESHLASCADCAQKLAEARGRVAMISFAAARVEPAPHVKELLLARVRAEGRSAAPERAVAPRADESSSGGGVFGRWWTAVLAPVGVALAIATILLWNQNERLNREMADLHAALAQQQRQLDESQHANDLLAARDTVVVPLAHMPGTPEGAARVAYNEHMGMLMFSGTVAPPPADKSYQLWVVPTQGAPINAGVFNPKQPGETDHWMMKMPPGVTPAAFAITLEPAGGMPQPTGPKVLAGSVPRVG